MLQKEFSKLHFPFVKNHHFAKQFKTQKCKHVKFDILAKPCFETLHNDYIDLIKYGYDYC